MIYRRALETICGLLEHLSPKHILTVTPQDFEFKLANVICINRPIHLIHWSCESDSADPLRAGTRYGYLSQLPVEGEAWLDIQRFDLVRGICDWESYKYYLVQRIEQCNKFTSS